MQRVRCPFVRVKKSRRPVRVPSHRREVSTISLDLARELIEGVVASYVIEHGWGPTAEEAADPAGQGTSGGGEDHGGEPDPE